MRPVGTFDQDVGKDFGDQFAGSVLIEEGDGVDGLQLGGELGPLEFVEQRAGGAFEALDAGIGVEREDEDVAEGAGLFKGADVAGMEQVVAAVGEDDGFAFLFPAAALLDEFRAAVQSCHRTSVAVQFQIMAETLAWLMEGDPSIRWQALRDLKGASERVVRREQGRVAREGWGARLLGLQDLDGRWAGGLYNPKWTSTTYTLVLLRSLGLPAGNRQAVRASGVLLDTGFYGDGGINFYVGKHEHSETCISSMVLGVLAWFEVDDPRVDRLADHVMARQMADGGWNCRYVPGRGTATHGSFHTTILALEALLDYERFRPARAGRAREAQARGREFLLVHRLFRSHRTGAVVKAEMTRFAFPPRWHYDVLRGLDYFREAGAPADARLEDALALVKSRQKADGRWVLQNRYPGKTFFELEEAGAASRWNTLRALRVLEHYNR